MAKKSVIKVPHGKTIGVCGVGNNHGRGCAKGIFEDDEWLFDGSGNKWHVKCFHREFGYLD